MNKNGTTTMTIRVNGARADSGTQTVIHYSTTIGDASDPDHDVRNNDSFTNHATIQSKRNMAPPYPQKRRPPTRRFACPARVRPRWRPAPTRC